RRGLDADALVLGGGNVEAMLVDDMGERSTYFQCAVELAQPPDQVPDFRRLDLELLDLQPYQLQIFIAKDLQLFGTEHRCGSLMRISRSPSLPPRWLPGCRTGSEEAAHLDAAHICRPPDQSA